MACGTFTGFTMFYPLYGSEKGPQSHVCWFYVLFVLWLSHTRGKKQWYSFAERIVLQAGWGMFLYEGVRIFAPQGMDTSPWSLPTPAIDLDRAPHLASFNHGIPRSPIWVCLCGLYPLWHPKRKNSPGSVDPKSAVSFYSGLRNGNNRLVQIALGLIARLLRKSCSEPTVPHQPFRHWGKIKVIPVIASRGSSTALNLGNLVHKMEMMSGRNSLRIFALRYWDCTGAHRKLCRRRRMHWHLRMEAWLSTSCPSRSFKLDQTWILCNHVSICSLFEVLKIITAFKHIQTFIFRHVFPMWNSTSNICIICLRLGDPLFRWSKRPAAHGRLKRGASEQDPHIGHLRVTHPRRITRLCLKITENEVFPWQTTGKMVRHYEI